MKVIAVINVNGGSMKGQDAEAFRATLAATFEKHGVDAELKLVEGSEVGAEAAQAVGVAKEGKAAAVVAGGGDGTIRTVAGLMLQTDIPLGIMPLGTLNHFAKDLGIPLALEDAVAVIAGGATRIVDAAEVNGEIFVNNSSIGIYPYMVADRERRTESAGLPKWIAALFASFRMLRRWPLRRFRLSAEGHTGHYRTPFLFIGNNEYDPATLGKREVIDAGTLWVSIAKRQSRLAFVALAFRSIFNASAQPDLEVLTSRSVEVRSHTSRLPVSLDGEVQTMQPPLRYRSIAGGLRVLVPAAGK